KGDLHGGLRTLPAIRKSLRTFRFECYPFISGTIGESPHTENLCPVHGKGYDFLDLLVLCKIGTVDDDRVGRRSGLLRVPLITLGDGVRLIFEKSRSDLHSLLQQPAAGADRGVGDE